MAVTFLASLSGGMLAVLSACRLQQVAWKFVRLIGAVAFVLAGVVLIAWMRSASAEPARWAVGLTIATAATAFSVMVAAPLGERAARVIRLLCLAGGCAGIAAGCAWWMVTAETGGGTGRQAAIVAGQVSGALLLGSVTVAWMLGHAYLTATSMTIAPLRRLARVLAAATAIRLAYVAASMVALWLVAGDSIPPAALLAASWPALSLRIVAGLVLLAVFAYMVMDCVRLRSTQSATGILYFASLLAYVGELSSQYLVRQWNWPL